MESLLPLWGGTKIVLNSNDKSGINKPGSLLIINAEKPLSEDQCLANHCELYKISVSDNLLGE